MSDYAFAIIQDFNCWCSNYAPSVTSSSSNCNTVCPGYNEFCGGNGYYGYIALNLAPSGTSGVSDSAAPSTPAVSNSSVPRSVLVMLHSHLLASTSCHCVYDCVGSVVLLCQQF